MYKLSDTSLSSQRQRLLDWLRKKPITTIQARQKLNIIAPAPRIFELRHNEGHNIVTYRMDDYTFTGHKHRVAKYVLLSGNKKGGSK